MAKYWEIPGQDGTLILTAKPRVRRFADGAWFAVTFEAGPFIHTEFGSNCWITWNNCYRYLVRALRGRYQP